MNDTNTAAAALTDTDMALTQTLFCEHGTDLVAISKIINVDPDALYSAVVARGLNYGGNLDDEKIRSKKALEDAEGSVAGAMRLLDQKSLPSVTAITYTSHARKYGWSLVTRGRGSSLESEQIDDMMQAYDAETATSGNKNMALAAAVMEIQGSLTFQSVANIIKKELAKTDSDGQLDLTVPVAKPKKRIAKADITTAA